MPKFGKFAICLALELGCTFAGLYIGTWWPVRDVPRDQIGPGDGIGMLIFGFIGAVGGAAAGGLPQCFSYR